MIMRGSSGTDNRGKAACGTRGKEAKSISRPVQAESKCNRNNNQRVIR